MKRRHYANTFRGLLVPLLWMPCAQAATLAVDPVTGNLTVTVADSGASTVAASGGTNPAPYTVTVDLGAALTGDAVAQLGASVTRAGYTINNNGSLTGSLGGILATTSLNVTNSGTITGLTGAGVTATSGTVVSGAGLISGTTGVIFTGGVSDTLTLTGGSLAGTGGTAANLGNGDDFLNLSGSTVVTGNLTVGGGNDTVGISGGNITGNILGEGGNDAITIHAGTILGTVNAGIGDDILTINGGTLTGVTTSGGQFAATLGAGNDVIHINGGSITGTLSGEGDNDTYNFANGTTLSGVISGGLGSDTVNFAGDTLVRSSAFNAVTAVETLNKNGAGTTTTVVGAVQADVINLNAGTLFINGNISHQTTGSTVVINSAGTHLGGTLSGASGLWNADLRHTAGTFSPGSTLTSGGLETAVATLNLTTATFDGGSLLIHTNPPAATSDLLKTTGNLTLNNTPLVISPVTKDGPLTNMTIVDVGGTTTGTWRQPVIVFEPGYGDGGIPATPGTGVFTPTTFSITAVAGADDPDDIAIEVVHHYETLPGLTPFGAEFAKTLNSAVATASSDPQLADFLGSLDYSSQTDAARAINSFEPDGLMETEFAAVRASTLLHRVIEGQNQAARSTRYDNRAWASFDFADQPGPTQRLTLGGGGGSLIDKTHFGAVISCLTMDDWVSGGSELNSTTVGGYLGTGELVGWQWNVFAGYTMTEAELSGGSAAGGIPAARLEPGGDGWQFLLSGAYVVQNDRLSWGPAFGLEYVSMDFEKAYAVRPGGYPALGLDAESLSSLRLLLGAKFEYDMPGNTTPYFAIQYVHEIEGDAGGYRVSVNGGSFGVADPVSMDADSLILRAGIMHRFNRNWQAHAGYLGQLSLGSGDPDIHNFSLGVMANF